MNYTRVTTKKLKSKLFELRLRFGDIDTLAIAFGLGYYIISEILGADWVESKIAIWGDHHGNFFKSKRLTEFEKHQYQGRLMQFADALFILQDMYGFGSKVEELSKISKRRSEYIEDVVVELHIAKLIFLNNKHAKFIAPIQGSNVSTPDLEIPTSDNTIFAEIKCRREEYQTNERWLWKHLNQASKQLKDSPLTRFSPTCIFLRIGPYLKNSTDADADGEKIVNKFFRSNSHINFVLFIWENWFTNTNGSGGYIIKFKKFDNPKPSHPVASTNILIQKESSQASYDRTFLPYAFIQAINI